MTIYIEGNGNNVDLTFTDSVTNDWFTLGNGLGDFVEATTNVTMTSTAPTHISNDVVTLGNGAGDFVQVVDTATATANATGDTVTAAATAGGDISYDLITLGNGAGDFVQVAATAAATANANGNAGATATATAGGTISHDIITLGNGAGDFVQVAATANANANANVTVGSGDSANATATAGGDISYDISNDVITFGNGAGDFVEVATAHANAAEGASAFSPAGGIFGEASRSFATGPAVGDISNDVITFGNGAGDFVLDNGNVSNDIITFRDNAETTSPDYVQAFGNISNNTITFGNGNGDYLSVTGSSSNNTITFGNGNGDYLSILGSGAGRDVIVTGTGLDTVTVGVHTNADTFGFSLGTNGSSYTAVNGAQVGDLVTSGNSLGNIVSNSSANYANLESFIASLTPSNGHTYLDNNGTDTFIVTDSGSHIGAIEIVGSFAGTVANHVLTLHAAEMTV